MGEIILELKDFSCGYGEKNIIHNINFNVNKGDIFSILGPNGSGKTTLIRAISRLIKPSSGNVLFYNKDIYVIPYSDLAKKMAVVSQHSESGWMKVREYILMGRIPYFRNYQFFETAKDREIAEKYMEMTGAVKFCEKSMWEISGGERQLAVITRALTQEPELLLLDEPTAHLDITHQVGILDLVKKLNNNLGITVVIILHDLNLASVYSDRILLLSEGRIYSGGTPEEVLTYKAIEDVYKTVVVVEKNPISGKPYVLLVTEEERKKNLA